MPRIEPGAASMLLLCHVAIQGCLGLSLHSPFVGTSLVTCFQIVNKSSDLSLDVHPTLFLEFHGSEAGLAEQASIVCDIAKEHGGQE